MPVSTTDPPPLCEICGSSVVSWSIGRGCVLRRCGACGHLHRDLSECLAAARGHAWGGDALFNRIRAALTSLRVRRLFLRGAKPRAVFEIGYGDGALLKSLLARGHEAGGVERGWTECRPDPALPGRAVLLEGRVEDMRLAPRWDLICSIHCIEHVDDPRAFAARAFEGLRPGGALYLLTPDGGSWGLRLFRAHWWNLEDPTHVRFFTRASLRRLLEDAGFRAVIFSTPLWDSLTLEINSLRRALRARCGKPSGAHGVLATPLAKALNLALLPIALLARCVCPRLAPTLEVRAVKPGQDPRVHGACK